MKKTKIRFIPILYIFILFTHHSYTQEQDDIDIQLIANQNQNEHQVNSEHLADSDDDEDQQLRQQEQSQSQLHVESQMVDQSQQNQLLQGDDKNDGGSNSVRENSQNIIEDLLTDQSAQQQDKDDNSIEDDQKSTKQKQRSRVYDSKNMDKTKFQPKNITQSVPLKDLGKKPSSEQINNIKKTANYQMKKIQEEQDKIKLQKNANKLKNQKNENLQEKEAQLKEKLNFDESMNQQEFNEQQRVENDLNTAEIQENQNPPELQDQYSQLQNKQIQAKSESNQEQVQFTNNNNADDITEPQIGTQNQNDNSDEQNSQKQSIQELEDVDIQQEIEIRIQDHIQLSKQQETVQFKNNNNADIDDQKLQQQQKVQYDTQKENLSQNGIQQDQKECQKCPFTQQVEEISYIQSYVQFSAIVIEQLKMIGINHLEPFISHIFHTSPFNHLLVAFFMLYITHKITDIFSAIFKKKNKVSYNKDILQGELANEMKFFKKELVTLKESFVIQQQTMKNQMSETQQKVQTNEQIYQQGDNHQHNSQQLQKIQDSILKMIKNQDILQKFVLESIDFQKVLIDQQKQLQKDFYRAPKQAKKNIQNNESIDFNKSIQSLIENEKSQVENIYQKSHIKEEQKQNNFPLFHSETRPYTNTQGECNFIGVTGMLNPITEQKTVQSIIQSVPEPNSTDTFENQKQGMKDIQFTNFENNEQIQQNIIYEQPQIIQELENQEQKEINEDSQIQSQDQFQKRSFPKPQGNQFQPRPQKQIFQKPIVPSAIVPPQLKK